MLHFSSPQAAPRPAPAINRGIEGDCQRGAGMAASRSAPLHSDHKSHGSIGWKGAKCRGAWHASGAAPHWSFDAAGVVEGVVRYSAFARSAAPFIGPAVRHARSTRPAGARRRQRHPDLCVAVAAGRMPCAPTIRLSPSSSYLSLRISPESSDTPGDHAARRLESSRRMITSTGAPPRRTASRRAGPVGAARAA